MRINIVMPSFAPNPIGGFKIIYEYANYFVKNGHDVYIYESRMNSQQFRKATLKGKVHLLISVAVYKLKLKRYKRPNWFSISNKVRFRFTTKMEHHFIENGDVIIATSLQTANFVNELDPKKGKKFYFIQHFETFLGTDQEILESWKLPMTKIVIATWLKEIAEKNHIKVNIVKNFVDPKNFYVVNSIDNRNQTISMLFHRLPEKGSQIGIEALKQIKKRFPNCTVKIFGVYPRPHNLLSNFEYVQNASVEQLREIYNESTIFLSTSRIEGWGLTSTEAMACGAALVSTQSGGVKDFGIDGRTALLSDVDDVNGLVENVTKLLTDNSLRTKIAQNGVNEINKLTIKNSGRQFIEILEGSKNEE